MYRPADSGRLTAFDVRLQEEMSRSESHSAELQRQNTLLHQQLQSLSSTVAASLQRAPSEAPSEAPLSVSFTEEAKSQDQVLEILG